MVNDPDIGDSYQGGCENGLAHGQGRARGRDIYVGGFFEGEPHGTGTYRWGPTSEWAGEVYTGDFLHGNRTGFGKYEEPTGTVLEGEFVNGKLHGFAEIRIPRKGAVGLNLREEGFWEDDVWILRGFYREGDFVLPCEDTDDCISKWTELQEKEKVEAAARQKREETRRQSAEIDRLAEEIERNLAELRADVESQQEDSSDFWARQRAKEAEDRRRQTEARRQREEEQERRAAEARAAQQARQMCEAQKQSCLAACTGIESSNCRRECYKIDCY